jgi:hypothetical protein
LHAVFGVGAFERYHFEIEVNGGPENSVCTLEPLEGSMRQIR